MAKEKVFFAHSSDPRSGLAGRRKLGIILISVGFEPLTSRYSRSPRPQLNGVSSILLSQAGFFSGVKEERNKTDI